MSLFRTAQKMLVHIENMNVESNKEFLDVSGSIRKSDEGINLVDVSFDLHHLVDEPIFVREYYVNLCYCNYANTSANHLRLD